jgi:cap1 methyltransferase
LCRSNTSGIKSLFFHVFCYPYVAYSQYTPCDVETTMASLALCKTAKKRSRSSSNDEPIEKEPRDCYETILKNGPTACNGAFGNLFHSWLLHQPVLSQSNVQLQHSNPTESELLVMRQELSSLSQQLTQVKRRLAPAADRLVCNTADAATNSHREFTKARKACNPMESLETMNIFLNRSAIKLANLDAILEFALTARHKDSQLPFRFADLCAAPGGFSEYLVLRCRHSNIAACQGYGMSLVGMNDSGAGLDWKVQDTAFTEDGLYSSYSICKGVDGTGDILNWENVEAFRQLILNERSQLVPNDEGSDCLNQKVHLVVGDGGVDAQRDVENQEEVTQQLVLCQVASALELLNKDGNCIVKMFGFQTTVSRNIMLHLFDLFETVQAIKPISSRPASAERYVACRGFKGNPVNWDWREWQNKVLLRTLEPDPASISARFLYALDEFDRDILNLNSKSCSNILVYLETKSAGSSEVATNSVYATTREMVNAYKDAWRLV